MYSDFSKSESCLIHFVGLLPYLVFTSVFPSGLISERNHTTMKKDWGPTDWHTWLSSTGKFHVDPQSGAAVYS